MIEFNFSIIQWHSNSEVIIWCGSSKHLFFCCICYFQWPSENCPLHSFITCWSSQTTFVSENRVSSVTSKRMRKSHMKSKSNEQYKTPYFSIFKLTERIHRNHHWPFHQVRMKRLHHLQHQALDSKYDPSLSLPPHLKNWWLTMYYSWIASLTQFQ